MCTLKSGTVLAIWCYVLVVISKISETL